MNDSDVLIVGCGIVGLATAMALSPHVSVCAIESEAGIARHQTGHNSGVIHSGLYYKPGSAKALNCTVGRELLFRFCEEHDIPHERCGKLVVATSAAELPALAELERRGIANGLVNLRRLGAADMRALEPHVAGVAGLHVRETGIVDYKAVAAAFAARTAAAGGRIHTATTFLGCTREPDRLVVETTAGAVRAKLLVNCAGLHADEVARRSGIDPGVRIVPFRGEYAALKPRALHLCKHLIYPVPDPRLPFLGVHFTRTIGGGVECGPNAVLAFRRDGYRFSDFSLREMLELAGYRGFWKMAGRFWQTGLMELYRSLSRRAFWKSLRRLVPELSFHDLVPAGAGVRAQAVAPDGKLVDDFVIRQSERTIHVLNAPSPAATASINIGRTIADLVLQELKGRTTTRSE